MRTLALVIVGLSVFAAGCSQEAPEVTAVEPTASSSSTTEVETTTTAPLTSSTAAPNQNSLEQVALDYFETVAEQTYTRGSGLAEAGSFADLYAFYIAEISKVYLVDPVQSDRIVDSTDGELTLRSSGPDGSFDIVYSDIEVSSEGVVTFAVDGVPLAERMSRLSEPTSNSASIEVSLALVYLSAGGNRFALVEVNNQSGSDWDHQYTASFVASDGSQDDSLETVGVDTVRSGARGLVFFVFDGDPGDVWGELYIDAFIDDFVTDAGLVLPFGAG